MIPEQLVDLAAKAMYASQYADPFERVSGDRREEFLEMARAAIESVAPRLMEQAWDEGWNEGASWPQNDINPYKSKEADNG